MPAPGFVRLADMPGVRSGGTTTVTTVNGLLYVAGGIRQLSPTVFNTFWSYDLVANAWTTLAPIPIPVYDAGMCTMGNKIYIIGGITSSGFVKTLYEYDISTNVWTRKADIPTTEPTLRDVIQPVACAIGTTMHLITYDLDFNVLHYWKWEQATNTWNHLAVSTPGLGPAMGVNVLLGDIYMATATPSGGGSARIVRLEGGSQFHRLAEIPLVSGATFVSALTGGNSASFGMPARDLLLYPNGSVITTDVRHHFWEYNIITNAFTTIEGRSPTIGIASTPELSALGSFSGGFVGNVIFAMGGLISSGTADNAAFYGMDLGGATPVEPVPTDMLDSWYVGQGGIWHRGTPQIGPTNLHGRTYVGKNGVWTPANRID